MLFVIMPQPHAEFAVSRKREPFGKIRYANTNDGNSVAAYVPLRGNQKSETPTHVGVSLFW